MTVTACKQEYTLIKGVCEPCGDNFATCVSNTEGTTCMPGFYKSIKSCIACPSPSKYCTSDQDI